jgi:hypothetical protein
MTQMSARRMKDIVRRRDAMRVREMKKNQRVHLDRTRFFAGGQERILRSVEIRGDESGPYHYSSDRWNSITLDRF